MQLTVNYSYIEQVIPPRCRKPRPVRFNDGAVVLNIQEVTTEQAPVAIIAMEQGGEARSNNEQISYRWFGGRLWTNCPVYACLRRNEDLYPALPPVLDLVGDSAMLSHIPLGIYVCVRDGKQAVAEHLQGVAEDLLIVDGQLHRPAGEPRYVVMTFGLSNNHGGTSLLCADYLNPNIRPEAYFSLLEHLEATNYTKNVAKNRGDTVKQSVDPGFRFAILIPEAIQWKNPSLNAEQEQPAPENA